MARDYHSAQSINNDGGPEGFLKDLDKQAEVYTVVHHSTSILRYYRMASMLHSQATQYLEEKDEERAYVQLKKFAKLYLYVIASHNSFNSKTYQPEKHKYKRLCNKALTKIKDLRAVISAKYVSSSSSSSSRSAGQTSLAHETTTHGVVLDSSKMMTTKLHMLNGSSSTASPSQHDDLKKAQSTKEHNNDDNVLVDKFALLRAPSKLTQMKNNNANRHLSSDVSPKKSSSSSMAKSSSSSSSPYGDLFTKKTTQSSNSKNTTSSSSSSIGRKAGSFFNLRRIRMAADLTKKFMKYAERNTRNDKETCGILCGALKNNRFDITAVVLPQQSGTANTTTTMGEEKLIELQESKNLLTLGWIHTHPSQACFLSSIDLHTQFSYQVMMPEAIAIVMAPTDRRRTEGIFSLTDRGLSVLSSCNKSGFHEHPQPGSLYRNALHVEISKHSTTTFYDLR
mmetsp:Transcript_35612/g.49865  ORF Transcript_35612/g.49865 Transcript_35612/m.49865 type:complete len:452 (-) Transcript_35612:142-1497(-)